MTRSDNDKSIVITIIPTVHFMISAMEDYNTTGSSVNNHSISNIELFYPFIPYFTTISAVIIINNVLVILTVYYTPKLRMDGNVCIVNMAVADLIIGIFKIPTYILIMISSTSLDGIYMYTYNVIDTWIFALSTWSLVAISADRYVAVTRPLYYQKISWQSIISSLWVLSFLVAVLIEIGGAYWYDDVLYERSRTYVMVLFVLMFCVPLSTMLYFYAAILHQVSTPIENNKKLNNKERLKICEESGNIYINATSNSDKSEISLLTDWNIAKVKSLEAIEGTETVFFIIALFMITNMALWTLWLINVFDSAVKEIQIFYVADLIFFSCSALNPFVYAFLHKVFRDRLKQILCNVAKNKVESTS